MTRYRVTFLPRAQIDATVEAESTDAAAELAWDVAERHLKSALILGLHGEVSIRIDMDGQDEDEINEVPA